MFFLHITYSTQSPSARPITVKAGMDPQPFDNNAFWPQVGMIKTFFPFLQGKQPPLGPYQVGTGTLIHPKLILTAAHNLFNWSLGGQTLAVEVTFSGTERVTSTTVNVVEEWKDTTNANEESMSPLSAFDCGVIILDNANANNVAAIRRAAVFRTTMDQIRNVLVGVVGYPSDPRRPDLFNKQAWGSSPALDVTDPPLDYRVTYATDSLSGMSGGPVYTVDPSGQLQVRAVNTSSIRSPAGDSMGNGLLIYPALAAKIGEWITAIPTT